MTQNNTSLNQQSDSSKPKLSISENNDFHRLFVIALSIFSLCFALIISCIAVYYIPQVIFFDFFLTALFISASLIFISYILINYVPYLHNLFNNNVLLNQINDYETTLQDQQQRFNDFTEIASDWLWEMDQSLIYSYISERFFTITGFTRDQYIGLCQIDLAELHPGNQEWEDHLNTITSHKLFRDFTYSVKLPDGSTRWLRINGNPRFTIDGDFMGYSGTGADITAELQAREEAVETTHRFFNALENVSDGVSFWDDRLKFVLANRIFREHSQNAASQLIRGTPFEDYLGEMVSGMLKGASKSIYKKRYNYIHKSIQNPRSSFEITTNGRTFLIRSARSPDGFTVIVTTDVSELKQREQELKMVMDAVPIWLCYVDKSLKYRQSNLTLQSWYGISPSEIRGQQIQNMMSASAYEIIAPHINQVLSGEPVTFISDQPFFKDAETGPPFIELTYTPDKRENGDIHGFFVAAKDISDRKNTEEQLRHSQKMEAIGQLAGGIAHDFNNLLAVILGSLGMLEEYMDSKRNQKLVSAALRATRRGADLTQRLLASGRRQALRSEPTDINSLIKGTIELVGRTIGITIKIETQLPDNLWTMSVDQSQLENALINLSLNARDSMSNGGKLFIETANAVLDEHYTDQYEGLNPGAYVLVAFSDTGCGMDKQTLERATEPFFTTKPIGKGSGLGLSMIYGFVRQSGGHVRLYSEPGKGTTVRLYLPVAESEDIIPPEPNEVVASGFEGNGLILVIDDDPDVLEISLSMIDKLGYKTLAANNAEKAIALFEAHPEITLVFSDVFLTGGPHGPDIAKEIRSKNPKMPILFTSGYTANQINADDTILEDIMLLSKPFTLTELAHIIRKTLDVAIK